jgi:DNA-binding transcriptional LysR family regulator
MAKDLEVRHCRALLALHERGGVGAAARALGVAQSTLSETLLSLERLLGFPVTVRRPGSEATLTPAALRLLPHARALVAASEAAMASAQTSKEAVIRLGAVESVSSHLLPGPLHAFSRQSPHVDVRVASGVCTDLYSRIDQRQLDAALTLEVPHAPRRTETEELARIRLQLVVPPDHALGGRVLRRAELSDQTFLLADPEGAFSEVLTRWLGGAQPPRIASAGSTDGVKRGVARQGALGLLPAYTVTEELASGALVGLEFADPGPTVSLNLTTSENPLVAPAVADLVELIRADVASAAPVGGA